MKAFLPKVIDKVLNGRNCWQKEQTQRMEEKDGGNARKTERTNEREREKERNKEGVNRETREERKEPKVVISVTRLGDLLDFGHF